MHARNQDSLHASRIIRPRIWTGLLLNESYRVGSLIEQGATTELYEGTEVSTGEPVALKILLPRLAEDAKTRALFLDEARVLARLSQPGLLRYRACARDTQFDLTYIVTDVVGVRLSSRLGARRPGQQDIVDLTRRLARALAAAHRAGIIHRGLSPHAIVLPEGRLAEATVADFNLIKAAHAGLSPAFDNAMLDHAYCAPEQLSTGAAVGPWTDVYSLALVILALLGGKPADAEGRASTDLSHLPRKLRPVFAKMLEPSPTRRIQSMDDVVKQVDRARDSAPLQALLDRASIGSGGAVRRAAVAFGALLLAASPWIIQTSLPRGPADASTVAPARQQVQAPAPSAAPNGKASSTAPLPQGRVYGADNTYSRITLRIHRPTRVTVHSRGDRLLFDRLVEPGDVYHTPTLPDLTVSTEDAGAVEVLLNGTPMGFVGQDGVAAERAPLRQFASVAPPPATVSSVTAERPAPANAPSEVAIAPLDLTDALSQLPPAPTGQAPRIIRLARPPSQPVVLPRIADEPVATGVRDMLATPSPVAVLPEPAEPEPEIAPPADEQPEGRGTPILDFLLPWRRAPDADENATEPAANEAAEPTEAPSERARADLEAAAERAREERRARDESFFNSALGINAPY